MLNLCIVNTVLVIPVVMLAFIGFTNASFFLLVVQGCILAAMLVKMIRDW